MQYPRDHSLCKSEDIIGTKSAFSPISNMTEIINQLFKSIHSIAMILNHMEKLVKQNYINVLQVLIYNKSIGQFHARTASILSINTFVVNTGYLNSKEIQYSFADFKDTLMQI